MTDKDTATLAEANNQVDADNPWLGLASFSEETRGYFYGREDEVAELARRVQRKLLTVLFGQSGLGKTSILRAGLVPKLATQGYCPVYVRIDYGREAPEPAVQIKQAIARSARRSGEWTQTGVAVEGESLWEFLHHRDDVLRDEAGQTLLPLLIFDQFEEIFTLAQSDEFGRARAARFVADLADLVENRPPKELEARFEADDGTAEKFDFARSDYRVLLSLREDYLAPLEGLKSQMPSLSQNRLRLAPMTGTQALAAVIKPGGRLVTDEVAAAIVRFVAGGAELGNAEVEPSLLSLICRELNDKRRADGRTEISLDLLAGSHATILSEFYERSLADQPAGVRRVVEDELLTESGFRENVAEERLRSHLIAAGASPETLGVLVNRRLLRIEERLDVRRVELTHDVLCSVVRASRDVRKEREARDATERLLAEQRERERATRRALGRARRIAIGSSLLALVAVVSAVLGFWALQRARTAERFAEETRMQADVARGEAEKLMAYLLDDFYLALQPVGKLDLLKELAEREISYYQQLPPGLKTPDTVINQARAETRLGGALLALGDKNEPDRLMGEAVATLERLYDAGNRSDELRLALPLALSVRASVRGRSGDGAGALADTRRGLELIEPLGKAPGAPAAVRRQYGNALDHYAYGLLRNGHYADAVPQYASALGVFRGIDNLTLRDTPAAESFTSSTAFMVEALTRAGRHAESFTVGDEGLDVARRLLAEHPDDKKVLRALAILAVNLASAAGDTLQISRGQAYVAESEAASAQLLKLDPKNETNKGNSANAPEMLGYMAWASGRPAVALAELDRAMAIYDTVRWDVFIAYNTQYLGGHAALAAAEVGDARRTAAALRYEKRALDLIVSTPDARDSWPFARVMGDALELIVQEISGAHADVLSRAPALLAAAGRLPGKDEGERVRIAGVQVLLGLALANARFDTGDFAGAAAAAGAVGDAGAAAGKFDPETARDADRGVALEALAFARSGNRPDALAKAGPALARQREILRVAPEAAIAKLNVAEALLAFGAAKGPASAELREATAIIAALPAEFRATRSVTRVAARIASARHGWH